MPKDFTRWHGCKARLDLIAKRPFFHEREMWFCHLGVNIGYEQDGIGQDFQRPVVIVRKFNNEIFWGIPLSRTVRRGKYYFSFVFDSSSMSVAILSQIRLIDARRLSRKIGEMEQSRFEEMKIKIKALLP